MVCDREVFEIQATYIYICVTILFKKLQTALFYLFKAIAHNVEVCI